MIKNKYVWINPVARSLYPRTRLDAALCRQGFTPIECEEDMLTRVQEKYLQAVRHSACCVADQRCPKAAEYLQKHTGATLYTPEIEPILIHCARALAAQYGADGNLIFITTPCKCLSDYGNELALPNTKFLPWNEFAAENQIVLAPRTIERSPIPPGFFSQFAQSISLKSKQEMDDFLRTGSDFSPYQVAELLYCENGCHNGDGMEMGWLR